MTKETEKKVKDSQWMHLTGKEIYQFFHKVKGRLQGIQVHALVGSSGTGKSFRARLLAEKINVDFIIDDGLLIGDASILAGRSAKQEKNYIRAIKTALFTDPEHRESVVKALHEKKVKRVLILGTSDKMVKRIAERLELPPITDWIRIEEIASKNDIENAIKSRKEEGKHIIPVPVIEVKRDYAQILSDSIKIFFKGGEQKSKIFEKAVVQPDFHNKTIVHPGADDEQGVAGGVSISEAALTQMILHCIDEYDDEIQVIKIKVNVGRAGYRVKLSFEVPYGKTLTGDLHDLRSYITAKIQTYTGIILDKLEISIEKISEKRKAEPEKKKQKQKRIG